MARYNDYVQIPMGKNDIGAKTIGEYFEKLLLTLWDEQEDFSGKRPFGNGGWEYDVYASLISAGVVDGSLDEDGYVVDVTYSTANDIVCEMIKQIFSRDADVVPKSEVEIIITSNSQLEAKVFEERKEIERLKHILDCYALQYGTVKDQQDVIDKANQEFASEIFAEIEKHIVFNTYGIATISDKTFAELKKKYTGGTK